MELINTIIVEINDREKSIILWFSLFCLWAISRKEIRSSFINVLKAFFAPKLFIPFLGLFFYVTFIISNLSKIGFWEPYLLKDTFVWFFGFAIITYFNINKVNEEDGFLIKITVDHFKLFVIIQFVVNMYVFNLAIELILTPLTTLLVGMLTISKLEKEYRTVEKVLQGILSIVGTIFIVFSFSKGLAESDSFFTSVTFHKLVLPPILSISLIPFIYLMALAILYETTFIRLKIKEY